MAAEASPSVPEALTDCNLLSRILQRSSVSDRATVRLLSRQICAAHDSQVQMLRARCHEGEDEVAQQSSSLRCILARGCRPAEVYVDVEHKETSEQRSHGLRLLQTFVDFSPLPTTELCIDAGVLAAHAAPRLVETAFPRLRDLTVWCDSDGADFKHSFALAMALTKLLRTEEETEDEAEKLPRIESLFISRPHEPHSTRNLPLILAASVCSATQLRKLRLDFSFSLLGAPLSMLMRLESLQLAEVAYYVLPDVLKSLTPLTALTSLQFGFRGRLPADVGLSGLTRLVELTAAETTLDASCLPSLCCLTRLECNSLCFPEAEAGPNSAARTWDLPPQLVELKLNGQPPQALPALRSPGSLARFELRIALDKRKHIGMNGALLPGGEAALCRAAGVIGDMGASHVAVTVASGSGTLLPVGGQAEAGSGRRNHTPWLEAVRQAGVSGLALEGVALSHQDMWLLPELKTLRTLRLHTTSYPMSALTMLAALPALKALELNVDSWFVGPSSVLVPLQARKALLELCSDARWAGKNVCVTLFYADDLAEERAAEFEAFVTAWRNKLGMGGAELRTSPYGAL